MAEKSKVDEAASLRDALPDIPVGATLERTGSETWVLKCPGPSAEEVGNSYLVTLGPLTVSWPE